MKRVSQAVLLLAFAALANTANAIDPIPTEPGWSGFVNLGVGALKAETNMVAGIDRYGLEIGDETVSSLSNAPDSKSTGIPQLNLNVNYTFASQTQVFLGNSLEDIVTLDTASVIGVRQQFADKSILALSAVSTPLISPVQVWEDPYVVGVARTKTDRTSRGGRIEYDKILGSGFGVQVTRRTTEIDSELSGTTQLGLAPAQAQLLNRNGDVKRLVAYYRFPRVDRNEFELRLGRRTEDLDGEAMSGDQNEIQLTYAYLGNRFLAGGTVFYWKEDYDAVNPVFNKTREDKTLGLALFLFDTKLFNSKTWWGQASAVWVNQDSNIDFYDASSLIVTVGVQYRF
ncbi:MAG: DUF2860 family protein [Pseudomonadota bacterium]|nr:MAG: DUF2860 family protein [Pseudomonadota bacterium]